MKIICIGRNYAAHAAELNNPLPDKPVIFLKPDTALLKNNSTFYYPDFSKDIHYECELVFRVCKEGKHISEKFAMNYVDKISVGIDFTARDLQDDCKAKGLPWERAKAFDASAVIGDMIELKEIKNVDDIEFSFYQNAKKVQHSNSNLMLFNLPRLIAEISSFITLKQGDLIYTGTPVGVGAIAIGDTLKGFIGDKELLTCYVK